MDVDLIVTVRFKADEVGTHIQEGFRELYKTGLFSDVVLVVNGVERFNVHKVCCRTLCSKYLHDNNYFQEVIAAWSDVLNDMIHHVVSAGEKKEKETEEATTSTTKEVHIELEEKLMAYFPKLLEYMYSGTLYPSPLFLPFTHQLLTTPINNNNKNRNYKGCPNRFSVYD